MSPALPCWRSLVASTVPGPIAVMTVVLLAVLYPLRTVLGDPLYVTGLVTGLWLVLRPQAPTTDGRFAAVAAADPSRFVR